MISLMSQRSTQILLAQLAALICCIGVHAVASAQYDGISLEDQADQRRVFETTSFINHFFKMDTSGDWATTMEEMDIYFSAMFYAFDADRDGVVSVPEAPRLLLQIRLMGKPFPAEGLDLDELRYRLDETFQFLDKNKNGKLGWIEML